MTDFEDRLTSALRSAGDDAPDATGLAPAARRRAGARRRRTALTSAAAVVAVAGVVGSAALLGNGDGECAEHADRPRVRRRRRRTLRQEPASSHGATSASPCRPPGGTAIWTTGAAAGATWARRWWSVPAGRPSTSCATRSTATACASSTDPPADAAYRAGELWQYEVGDRRPDYPEGAWLGYQTTDGNNVVLVVASDRATAEDVLGSFAGHGDSDPDGNGCLIHPRTEPCNVPRGHGPGCAATASTTGSSRARC